MKRSEEIRCLVIGSNGVGKTSLLVTKATGQFPMEHLPTVFQPIEVHKETFPLKQITIWDSANEETYDRQRMLSYVGTDLVLVCYSVTCPKSLQDVTEKWIPEIRRYSSSMPFVLVGLKSDQRSDHQRASKTSTTSTGSRDSQHKAVDSMESVASLDDEDMMPWLQEHFEEVEIVDKKLAKKVAKVQGALHHLECSAKTGQGVNFLMEEVLPKVLEENVLKKKKRSSLVKKLGKLLNTSGSSSSNSSSSSGSGSKQEGDSNRLETQSTRSN